MSSFGLYSGSHFRSERPRKRFRSLLIFLVGIIAALSISGATAEGILDLTYGPQGELGSLVARTDTGLIFAFVEGIGAEGNPLLLLVSSEGGVRRLIVTDEGEASFEPLGDHAAEIEFESGFLDGDARWKTEDQTAGEALGVILAIEAELGRVGTPQYIVDAGVALARKTKPMDLRLVSRSLPVGVMGCGAGEFREECDDCCDSEFEEDRKDCRDSWSETDPASWRNQQRCMQQAVLKLGNCSLMCSLKPVKPVE